MRKCMQLIALGFYLIVLVVMIVLVAPVFLITEAAFEDDERASFLKTTGLSKGGLANDSSNYC